MTDVVRRAADLRVVVSDGDRHAALIHDTERERAVMVNAPEDTEAFLSRHDVDPSAVEKVFVTDFRVDQTDAFAPVAEANDAVDFHVPDVSTAELEAYVEERADEIEFESGAHGNPGGYGPGEEIDTERDPEYVLRKRRLENKRTFVEDFAEEHGLADRGTGGNVVPLAEGESIRVSLGDPEADADPMAFAMRAVAPPKKPARDNDGTDVDLRTMALHLTTTPGNGDFDALFTGRLDPESVETVLDAVERIDSMVVGRTGVDDGRVPLDFDFVDAVPAGPDEEVSPLFALTPDAVVYTEGNTPTEAEIEHAAETDVRVDWQGRGTGDTVFAARLSYEMETTAVPGEELRERLATDEQAEDPGDADRIVDEKEREVDGEESETTDHDEDEGQSEGVA